MHRTQILLEQWQYDALRTRAAHEGRSLSSLVREIVTGHLRAAGPRRLEEIEGVADGPADLGREHDAHLYGDENRD